MKYIIVFLLLVAGISPAKSQNSGLPGTWSIIQCAYIKGADTTKVMDEEIRSGAAVTDYIFTEDGKYKMTSNMSGSGTTDTYEGSWKTSDDDLVTTITVNNQPMEIVWKYALKDNKLVLSRTSPDGTLTIANSFRKK